MEGLHRLATAVLLGAYQDLNGRGFAPRAERRKRNALEAREWFSRNDNAPFSFRWCCEILRLDHRAAQRFLL